MGVGLAYPHFFGTLLPVARACACGEDVVGEVKGIDVMGVLVDDTYYPRERSPRR